MRFNRLFLILIVVLALAIGTGIAQAQEATAPVSTPVIVTPEDGTVFVPVEGEDGETVLMPVEEAPTDESETAELVREALETVKEQQPVISGALVAICFIVVVFGGVVVLFLDRLYKSAPAPLQSFIQHNRPLIDSAVDSVAGGARTLADMTPNEIDNYLVDKAERVIEDALDRVLGKRAAEVQAVAAGNTPKR